MTQGRTKISDGKEMFGKGEKAQVGDSLRPRQQGTSSRTPKFWVHRDHHVKSASSFCEDSSCSVPHPRAVMSPFLL